MSINPNLLNTYMETSSTFWLKNWKWTELIHLYEHSNRAVMTVQQVLSTCTASQGQTFLTVHLQSEGYAEIWQWLCSGQNGPLMPCLPLSMPPCHTTPVPPNGPIKRTSPYWAMRRGIPVDEH
ncbi:hypothetical protein SUGI_0878310 [Cryptomeria japonica]|nr:hypothetical protein SUGI_0878310 [Cryptomeria japonica]